MPRHAWQAEALAPALCPPAPAYTLADIEALRVGGLSWPWITWLAGHAHGPAGTPQGPQVSETLYYLMLRSACAPQDEPEAARRAAIILLADPDADAYVRLLGVRPLIPEELTQ